MRHRHQRHAQTLGRVVHGFFNLQCHGRRALVQNRVLGRVVEEPGHGDALLQADGERRRPFVLGVPAGGPVDEVRYVDGLEPTEEVRIRDALGAHLPYGIRVDDLLAEGAAGEVGPLRDVEDGAVGRFADGAAVDGPQAAEDAEQGGFAAPVGADDEEVRAGADGEGEGGDEHVAVWGDDGDGGEFDVGAFDGDAAALEDGGVGGGFGGGDEVLFEMAGLDVVDYGEQSGHAGGVAGQFGDFFVGEHDSADGVGGGEQHAAIRDEALCSVAQAV